MAKKIKTWSPVVIWMAVIFFLSSRPDIPSNQIYILDFILKKSAHMVEFGILVFLLSRAYLFKKPDLSFLLALSYAFTDEIHQLFVPGRGGKLSDVFIDLLGIIIVTKLLTHRHSCEGMSLDPRAGNLCNDLYRSPPTRG